MTPLFLLSSLLLNKGTAFSNEFFDFRPISPTLDAEQRELVIDRALFEEKLMGRNGSPLEEETGEEGGTSTLLLQKEGLVRKNSVMSSLTANNLLLAVKEKLARERNGSGGSDVFANVLLGENTLGESKRFDLLLDFDDEIVLRATQEVLDVGGIGRILVDLFGLSAELYELSTMISLPGSARQTIHPDTPWQNGGLMTCFIALQDVGEEMGPTVFFPKTHCEESHSIIHDRIRRDDWINKTEHKTCLLSKGDSLIFDSRTLHAGTSNRSDGKDRVLFYFSFRDVNNLRRPSYLTNNTGSLKSNLKGRRYNIGEIMSL